MKSLPEVDSVSLTPSMANMESSLGITSRPRIRVVALVEGSTISGPAKNLFEFCRVARTLSTGPVVDLVVVTFHRSLSLAASRNTDFIEAARQADVTVESIPERFLFDVQVFPRLRKLLEQFRPDLIQTHASKSHFLLRSSGLWKETPWIAFHHGYTNTDFRSPIYNNLDRWSLQVPARIVTVSRATEQQLLRRGVPGQGITVLHNAVRPQLRQVPADVSVLQRKKIDLGILPEEMVILCVGRLSKEKAQIDMVRAMQHLRQISPKRVVRLMIVGDGPERGRISQAILSSGLQKHVVLAGHLKNLTPYYEAADVVAISSLSEGSPNALLEAMAFGVPVVATEVGGIPEIVTHGESALLVRAGNPGAMAAAIDLLFSNPDTGVTLARHALRKVETEYSPESRAQSLVSIYAEVNRLHR